ncbi:MAG TPA: hypothetical protein VFS44_07515 [Gemmatimonadaceae bacterium]|nr:hypothetical protein [Gemmatimonadaceae bacterium]
MPLFSILGAALIAATPTISSARADSGTLAPHTVQVTVDSAHQRIVVTAGPFDLMDMSNMGDEGMHQPSELLPFAWPVDGYLRGFRVETRDRSGHVLDAHLLHHLIGVNFDRRQLVYPAVERLFGWGAETDPVELPKSLGVPLARGEKLGMYAAFHNETGKDIRGAYLRVTLLYTPKKGSHVTPVMPFYVDVNNVIGGQTVFDIPPGHSSRSYEFTVPVSGRLIGVGGHLHDYGESVRLEDAETGKVLVRLNAKRDDRGHVLKVGRHIFGFYTDALPLEANHRYRVVAEYLNPTRKTVKNGAMAHINGAFMPADLAQWPTLDRNDPMIRKDIATLPSAHEMKQALDGSSGARGGHDMDHMSHMRHGTMAGHGTNMRMDQMPAMSHDHHDTGSADSTARSDSSRSHPRS